jgi:6-pyruvoyltetrahydropterin/6-carboxytetrahydropterin synthase
MYELRIERVFHADHAIRLYDGSLEPQHAHDWRTFAHITAERLDAIEVVMDFHELETIVDAALAPLRGTTLNVLPIFAKVNPTAERVAEHIYRQIAPKLPAGVKLSRLTVTESPGCQASFLG